MKANKIYLLKVLDDFNNSKNKDGDNFNHPFYEKLSQCINMDDSKYVDFSDFDDDIMLVQLPDYKIKNLCILYSEYMKYSIEDITSSVVSGKSSKKYPDVKLFNSFRMENTTIDDILDKINESGLNSLDNIDKEILKKS